MHIMAPKLNWEQMLGHTGGRSLTHLFLVLVYVRIKMFVSLGLVALLERKET
jgi:hypothetical protein